MLFRSWSSPLAVALLLAGTCGACSSSQRSSAPVTIEVGSRPSAIVVTADVAWVANAGDGTLSKIDVAGNRVEATLHVGDPQTLIDEHCVPNRPADSIPHGSFDIRACDVPRTIAASPGAIWVAEGDRDAIERIDPRTDLSVSRIPVGISPWYIAASADAVWATDYYLDELVRVDPRTNRVVATIEHLPFGPTGVAIAGGSVWVASSRANSVSRIDSATNTVTTTIPVAHRPVAVLYAAGSIWVRSEVYESTGVLTRIDPSTSRVLAEIPVTPHQGRDGLDGISAGSGSIWVPGLDVQRVDPATNRVAPGPPHMSMVTAYADGSLWTIDLAFSVTRFPIA